MSKFYTVEDAEMNQFYQLPKVLMHDEKYKKLTDKAKLSYAILKDRHSVSLKNNWIDDQNRVYFIFTDKELAKILETTPRTANKIKNDLKNHGLIEMHRQGLNQPNMIYLLKVEASKDADRKKTSYPDKKIISYPDRKKTSNQDRKKTSTVSKTNSSKTNNSNTNHNLSITESAITELDVPICVQKQLILKKDRLIDDNINILDIELMYNAYKAKMNEFEFAHILGNVLESTKGKIRNINHLMTKSITNHLKQPQQAEYKESEPIHKEVIPDWFRELKEKKERESSYQTDYSQYDFSGNKNDDWIHEETEDLELKELLAKHY